jgi:hypothetical protein
MYRVEPLGGVFSGRSGHEGVAGKLNALEAEGWELVQVFPVLVSGCLGRNKQTNYAVLRKVERSGMST